VNPQARSSRPQSTSSGCGQLPSRRCTTGGYSCRSSGSSSAPAPASSPGAGRATRAHGARCPKHPVQLPGEVLIDAGRRIRQRSELEQLRDVADNIGTDLALIGATAEWARNLQSMRPESSACTALLHAAPTYQLWLPSAIAATPGISRTSLFKHNRAAVPLDGSALELKLDRQRAVQVGPAPHANAATTAAGDRPKSGYRSAVKSCAAAKIGVHADPRRARASLESIGSAISSTARRRCRVRKRS
jgi:hypothetical protein